MDDQTQKQGEQPRKLLTCEDILSFTDTSPENMVRNERFDKEAERRLQPSTIQAVTRLPDLSVVISAQKELNSLKGPLEAIEYATRTAATHFGLASYASPIQIQKRKEQQQQIAEAAAVLGLAPDDMSNWPEFVRDMSWTGLLRLAHIALNMSELFANGEASKQDIQSVLMIRQHTDLQKDGKLKRRVIAVGDYETLSPKRSDGLVTVPGYVLDEYEQKIEAQQWALVTAQQENQRLLAAPAQEEVKRRRKGRRKNPEYELAFKWIYITNEVGTREEAFERLIDEGHISIAGSNKWEIESQRAALWNNFQAAMTYRLKNQN